MKSAASLTALLLLAGCGVDSQSGIVIEGFHPLVFDSDTLDCVSSDEDKGTTSGFYDAGYGQLGRSYYQYILIRNNLPTNEDASAGRLNSNDFQLESVEITIENGGPWKFLPSRQNIPLSSGVKVAGQAFVEVPMISPTLAAAMVEGKPPDAPSPIGNKGQKYELTLLVRAHGVLLDGSQVDSNELRFPMTIGNQSTGANCLDGQIPAGCGLVQTDGGIFPVQFDGWSCISTGTTPGGQ